MADGTLRPIRLRIVSDGTPPGTFVTDADTGRAVQGVKAIAWAFDAGESGGASVSLVMEAFELEQFDVTGDLAEGAEVR